MKKIDRTRFTILYYLKAYEDLPPAVGEYVGSLRECMVICESEGFVPSEYEDGKKLHRRYVRGEDRAEIVYASEWPIERLAAMCRGEEYNG